MHKKTTTFIGVFLILFGLQAALNTIVLPLFGDGWESWRLWPLLIANLGLAFVLAPLIFSEQRGLGGLFIPGIPFLTIGGMLLWGSLLNWWGIWELLWPLIIIAVALGFAIAAIHMRNIWLLIPAIIIGLNGLVFQFCTLTGAWHLWSVLWTIEPLAVGLALLVTGFGSRTSGLLFAGLIMCSIAGIGFMGMFMLTSAVGGFVGAVMLILFGGGLLLRGLQGESVFSSPKEEKFSKVSG